MLCFFSKHQHAALTSPPFPHLLYLRYYCFAPALFPDHPKIDQQKQKNMHSSTLFAAMAAGLLLLESGLAQQTTTSATTTATVADTFVFSIDLLVGETGYYNVEGYEGVQPPLTMVR